MAERGARGAALLANGEAQRTFAAGLLVRDQLVGALQMGAGQVPSLKEELDGAVGTAETGAALAQRLDGLVALGRRWLSGLERGAWSECGSATGRPQKHLAVDKFAMLEGPRSRSSGTPTAPVPSTHRLGPTGSR